MLGFRVLCIFAIYWCFFHSSPSYAKTVTYDIPPALRLSKDALKTFMVISSHGRDDSQLNNGSPPSAISNPEHPPPTIFQLGLRFLYLSLIFSPVIMTSGLACISSLFRTHVWFWLLSNSIAVSGAAFIKWGQWASTRPDIFPSELCAALENLQANAPEHSWAFTKVQIQNELGKPIEEIFESFDMKPLASGSIAQVYKARLNNQDVAVKVRHPNVRQHIEIDFILMRAFARMIESIPGLEWISLSESMIQFSVTIASQVHLDIEGRHLHLFNHNFRSTAGVVFPKPIILTPSILVESFEKGDSVAKFINSISSMREQMKSSHASHTSRASDNDKKQSMDIQHAHIEALENSRLSQFIVTRGENAYLKMLLHDNLMHADLHPGNILIQSTGDGGSGGSKKGYNIVLVDAGMVAKLTKTEQRNFIGMLTAMGDGNGHAAARFIMKFSSSSSSGDSHYSKETQEYFQRDMSELFSKVCRGYHHNTDIGEVLRGVLNLCRSHKIRIDANYATLVMNVLCLDGMAKALMPDYNILDGAKVLLQLNKFATRLPILRVFLPLANFLKNRHDAKFVYSQTKYLE